MGKRIDCIGPWTEWGRNERTKQVQEPVFPAWKPFVNLPRDQNEVQRERDDDAEDEKKQNLKFQRPERNGGVDEVAVDDDEVDVLDEVRVKDDDVDDDEEDKLDPDESLVSLNHSKEKRSGKVDQELDRSAAEVVLVKVLAQIAFQGGVVGQVVHHFVSHVGALKIKKVFSLTITTLGREPWSSG